MCPKCHSLERHRAQWLWLKNNIDWKKELKVFHVAPEGCFSIIFKNSPDIEYFQCDLNPRSDDVVKMDITEIKTDDNYFDLVICNHVLEHIDDDRKAIDELYRITKPEGITLISVPVYAEKTFEDKTITTPEERLRVYKQSDHVRLCGSDYIEKLSDSNIKISAINYEKDYSKFKKRLYGLDAEKNFVDIFYLCEKLEKS